MSNRPNLPRKRLYVFDSDDNHENARFVVVHTSLKEAKKWLWSDMDVRNCCYNEFIRFNAYWLKSCSCM